MIKNPKIDTDEINLIELMLTVWEGKWKIAAAVVISLLAVINYQSNKTYNFTAITEVKYVGSLEISRYQKFNNLVKNVRTSNNTNGLRGNFDASANANIENFPEIKNFPEITSLRLLKLYLDVLNDKLVFEDAIRKFNLLEASQYNNEQEYSEAIIRLASSVKILSPSVSANAKKGNLEISYHTINFTHHDAEKWKSILKYVDEFANKLIKKNLVDQYNNTLLFLKDKKRYQLEDISIKINNHLIDYDREMNDRLAYLNEQSSIAKKLGIANNAIEVQTFGNQKSLLSNIQTQSYFYLRGYEAIDKEIELIKLRKDKKAFIKGLFELEKEKRAIEQDRTIERVKLALQSNLLEDNNEFYAASINAITTKFEYKDYKIIYVIAIVIGLMAGILYVLISNAFQSHRVSKKK